MALQFVDFKKRLNNSEELVVSFNLVGSESLAIIDNDINNLKIFKKVFEKVEDYRGRVLINGIDVRKKSELYDFSDIGLYSNFTLYQNFRFLLKIYSIKIKKSELLEHFEELVLNPKKIYSKLDLGEKQRVEILLGCLFSKSLYIIDLSERKLINSRIIASFLRKISRNSEKNIVVLSREMNEISSLMSNVLIINNNMQEYFGKSTDFSIIKNLVVLKLDIIDVEKLEERVPFDFTIVNNKFIIEKNNLEAALYYFVSNDIEVEAISDFAENSDLYVKGE